MTDITFCSTVGCPLAAQCKRKDFPQNIALLYSEAFQWSPNGKCPFLMPKGEITVSNEIKDSCMGIIHILIAESL